MKTKVFLILITICSIQFCYSQNDSIPKAALGDNLEDKIQNPIANMVSVPVQYNYIFNDRPTEVTNIQPVIPISLSKDWLMITRTIIPLLSAPIGPSDRETGVGNVILTTAITPQKPSAFTFGFGPAFIFPTVTKNLGFRDFSVGPSFGALNQKNGWTYGGFIQQFFGVAGAKNLNGKHTSYFYAQIAGSKKLKKGWYINTVPVITADWTAPKGHQWTIPMGMGVGKLIRMKVPINAQVGIYKFLEHPSDADWFFRFQLTFIFLGKK